jgi:hypothetical protein
MDHQFNSSDKLFRWLHPGQFNWEEMRPTSAAFTDPYMSVDIDSLTTLEESYHRAQQAGKTAVVALTVEMVIEKDLRVCHCPTSTLKNSPESLVCISDEGCPSYRNNVSPESIVCINDAHGCVIGKKTNHIKKFLAKHCKVEVYPPQHTSSNSETESEQ